MSNVKLVAKHVRLQSWANLIQAQIESGLNIKDWCLQNGISRYSYYYWLRRVREHAISNMPVSVKESLPVEPDDHISFKKLEVKSSVSGYTPAVVIHTPDATLEVQEGLSQSTVEAVLLALKSIC